jgi:hypothetical protein
VHGIISKDFYQDLPYVFEGNFQEGFTVNRVMIDQMYDELGKCHWKKLCEL